MMDSCPPTVMVARLRDASRLLVEVPPELRSSSAPKRPLEVTAKVVFSRRVLVLTDGEEKLCKSGSSSKEYNAPMM